MRRRSLLAALLLAAACGARGLPDPRETGTAGDGPVPADPGGSSVVAWGRIGTGREALLYGSGRVTAVEVSVGDSVRAGQVLVTLSGDAASDAALSAAAAALEAARIDAARAGADCLRCAGLYEAGAVSELELECARAAARAADAALSAAVAGTVSAAAGRDAGLVEAPFDGTVSRVDAAEGSMAGRGPLVVLVGEGAPELEILLPEREMSRIAPGCAAEFETAALPGRTFAGIVVSVSPSPDPVTFLLPVTVRLDDPEGLLATGLYGTVRILTAGPGPS